MYNILETGEFYGKFFKKNMGTDKFKFCRL